MTVSLVLPSIGTYPNSGDGDPLRVAVAKLSAALLALLVQVNNPAVIDQTSSLQIATLIASLNLVVGDGGPAPMALTDNGTPVTPVIQAVGITASGARLAASYIGAGSTCAALHLHRSTGTVTLPHVATPSGTRLGYVSWSADNGAGAVEGMRMMAVTSAVAGATVPTDLTWFASGSGTFAEVMRLTSGGVWQPGADGTIDFGTSARRYNNIRASVATITTSDARAKDWRGALTAPELAAAETIMSQVGLYQLKSAVALKGAAARLHSGVIAQEVVAAFEAQGLDWTRYSLVGHDAWAATPGTPAQEEVLGPDGDVIQPAMPAVPGIPAGDSYCIRYEELAMFLLAAERQARLDLAARVAALETRAT